MSFACARVCVLAWVVSLICVLSHAHTSGNDWLNRASYQAIRSVWFQPLSDFLISQCLCHHQVEKQLSLGCTEVKAINSWLQGGDTGRAIMELIIRLYEYSPLGDCIWCESHRHGPATVSHTVRAPWSHTALVPNMMLYIIAFRTFTVAIVVKRKGWKVKEKTKTRWQTSCRVKPDKDLLIPTMSPVCLFPATVQYCCCDDSY